jgi:hypothetical protein
MQPRADLNTYSGRLAILYLLLIGDAVINATAEANVSRITQVWAAIALAGQISTRIGCILATISLLTSTRQWRDEFLLEFCGMFGVSLISMIICLFLRVYRVTLAAFPSQFPTSLSFWQNTEYCLLLTTHILLSLLFYYMSIMSAYRMGSLRYYRASHMSSTSQGGRAPSLYDAVRVEASRS